MIESLLLSELEQQLGALEDKLISHTDSVDKTVSQHETDIFNILKTLVNTTQALIEQSVAKATIKEPSSLDWWEFSSARPVLDVATILNDACLTLCRQCDSLCAATETAKKYLQSTYRGFLVPEDNSKELHQRFSASNDEAQRSLKAKQDNVEVKNLELSAAALASERQDIERELVAHKRENIKTGRNGLRVGTWLGVAATGGLLLPAALAVEAGGGVMRHKKKKYDALLAEESRLKSKADEHTSQVRTEVIILRSHVTDCENLVQKCSKFTTRTKSATTMITIRTTSYNNMKTAVSEFCRFVKDVQVVASMTDGVDTWLELQPHLQELSGLLTAKDKDFGRLAFHK